MNFRTHSISSPPAYPSTLKRNLDSLTASLAGTNTSVERCLRLITRPSFTRLPEAKSVPSVEGGIFVTVILSKSDRHSADLKSESLKVIFLPKSPVLISVTSSERTSIAYPKLPLAEADV